MAAVGGLPLGPRRCSEAVEARRAAVGVEVRYVDDAPAPHRVLERRDVRRKEGQRRRLCSRPGVAHAVLCLPRRKEGAEAVGLRVCSAGGPGRRSRAAAGRE